MSCPSWAHHTVSIDGLAERTTMPGSSGLAGSGRRPCGSHWLLPHDFSAHLAVQAPEGTPHVAISGSETLHWAACPGEPRASCSRSGGSAHCATGMSAGGHPSQVPRTGPARQMPATPSRHLSQTQRAPLSHSQGPQGSIFLSHSVSFALSRGHLTDTREQGAKDF